MTDAARASDARPSAGRQHRGSGLCSKVISVDHGSIQGAEHGLASGSKASYFTPGRRAMPARGAGAAVKYLKYGICA